MPSALQVLPSAGPPGCVGYTANTWSETRINTSFEAADAAASAGSSTRLQCSAIGQYVTYAKTSLAPSTTYSVVLRHLKTSNAGDFGVCMASSATGSCSATIATNVSGDSAVPLWETVTLGNVTTSSLTGTRYFRLTVTGKFISSTGYQVFPDFIDFIKQ